MVADPQVFRSNGKLMLTAEYLVLRGATSLAMPLKAGQSLKISPASDSTQPLIQWKAYGPDNLWFSVDFSLPELNIIQTGDRVKAAKLQIILLTLKQLRSDLFETGSGFRMETHMDFRPEWGFGSSSSLIANLAQWAGINPYTLLNYSIGGSGYDIACALADGPLFYTLDKLRPKVEQIAFNPPFRDKLYFVYLGKKQDSANGIRNFNKLTENLDLTDTVAEVSAISRNMASADSFDHFCALTEKHEKLLSGLLLMPPVKTRFPDFDGYLKSLGAWGGDFALAMYGGSEKELRSYFARYGLQTIFTFDELVK
jgi:mevalonate kinase